MGVNGIMGKKIGTTQVFRENGDANCVTAIRVEGCVITQIKTVENDGYEGVQLGYEPIKRINKPEGGHLKPSGGQFRHLRELPVDGIDEIEVGQRIDVGLFQAGDRVDAVGWSKGRGFAGGVKRHGFHGGPKTHGQSDRHRAPGSIGAGTSPGRVIKGLKMAGHMGNARVTVRNLEVVDSDVERGLLFVKGGVPGATNSLVLVYKLDGAKK
jgi:large subunit ribosomal protein L3